MKEKMSVIIVIVRILLVKLKLYINEVYIFLDHLPQLQMTRNSKKDIKEVMKAELDAIVAVNKKVWGISLHCIKYFFILLYKLNQLTAKQCSIFLHLHCLLKTFNSIVLFSRGKECTREMEVIIWWKTCWCDLFIHSFAGGFFNCVKLTQQIQEIVRKPRLVIYWQS